MSDREDERLRAAFAHLKANDRRRIPSFEASRQAPKALPIRTLWLVTGPLFAAAAVLVAVCGVSSSNDSERPRSASAPPIPVAVPSGMPASEPLAVRGADSLPLDFLLDDTFFSAKSTRAFLDHAPDFDSDFSKGSAR